MSTKSTSKCIQTPRNAEVHLEDSTTASTSSTSVLLQDRLVSTLVKYCKLHSATAFIVPEKALSRGETRLDWLYLNPLAHIRQGGKHLAGGVIGSSNCGVQVWSRLASKYHAIARSVVDAKLFPSDQRSFSQASH